MSTPVTQFPVLSAPQMPQKAPMSIMPSRPMFTTPLRSEKMPPSDPYISGVAKTSIEAISVDHVKTISRFSTLERVARYAPPRPRKPMTIAPHPTRTSPAARRRCRRPQRAPRGSRADQVAHMNGREREPECERAENDPGDPDPLRGDRSGHAPFPAMRGDAKRFLRRLQR